MSEQTFVRELERRADDVRPRHFGFDDIRTSARRIQRRRRTAVAGGVAAVVAAAVLLPAALLGGSPKQRRHRNRLPPAPLGHTAVLHDGQLSLPDERTVAVDLDTRDVTQLGLLSDGRVVVGHLAAIRHPGVLRRWRAHRHLPRRGQRTHDECRRHPRRVDRREQPSGGARERRRGAHHVRVGHPDAGRGLRQHRRRLRVGLRARRVHGAGRGLQHHHDQAEPALGTGDRPGDQRAAAGQRREPRRPAVGGLVPAGGGRAVRLLGDLRASRPARSWPATATPRACVSLPTGDISSACVATTPCSGRSRSTTRSSGRSIVYEPPGKGVA